MVYLSFAALFVNSRICSLSLIVTVLKAYRGECRDPYQVSWVTVATYQFHNVFESSEMRFSFKLQSPDF